MNKRAFLTLLFAMIVVYVSAQSKIKVPKKAMKRLESFKKKAKFEEDLFLEYSGISDELYKPELTRLIDLAADDFIEITKKEMPTKEAYIEKIETGLQRFEDVYENISQQDIDRICNYYEELMRYVNLKSSNGLIAKFRRGINLERN